jgi:hypothetical protein
MAKLSYGARKNLPTSSFAVVHKDGKGGHTVRKFPVNDMAHARNALARVSAFGSAAEKAAVKRKVASRFPGLASRSSMFGHDGSKSNSPHEPRS